MPEHRRLGVPLCAPALSRDLRNSLLASLAAWFPARKPNYDYYCSLCVAGKVSVCGAAGYDDNRAETAPREDCAFGTRGMFYIG